MESLKIVDEYGKWFDLKIGSTITLKRNTENVYSVDSFKEVEGEAWVRIKWFTVMMSPHYSLPLKQIKNEYRLSNITEKHRYNLVPNSIHFIKGGEDG